MTSLRCSDCECLIFSLGTSRHHQIYALIASLVHCHHSAGSSTAETARGGADQQLCCPRWPYFYLEMTMLLEVYPNSCICRVPRTTLPGTRYHCTAGAQTWANSPTTKSALFHSSPRFPRVLLGIFQKHRQRDVYTHNNLTNVFWTWEAVFVGKNGWPRSRCSSFQLFRKKEEKKKREKSGYPSEEEMFAMYVKHVLPSPLLLSAQQLLQLEEALWTVNLLIYVNRVLPRFENNILAENRLPRVWV